MPKYPFLTCVLVALTATVACSPATPLIGTYWKLVELNGAVVEVFTDQSEPHLVLEQEGEDTRLHGSGGCNNMMGTFTVEGDRLSFGPIAGTRMMCTEGMDQEHAFGQTLGKIERFEITGQVLTLSGSEETALRFEAKQSD